MVQVIIRIAISLSISLELAAKFDPQAAEIVFQRQSNRRCHRFPSSLKAENNETFLFVSGWR